jgi:hypothetical protein
MKTNTASLSVLGTLVIAALLVIGILKIQQAYAQVDASSSDVVVASSTNTTPVADATTSATADTATTEATATESTDTSTAAASDSVTPTEPPPQGLAEVHIIGTKYTDYFTDGTTITSYPGDPKIGSNFDKPNAPIPTREGLTWDHTTGQYLYDTPSGDLEVGDYAVQPNGSYIRNAPPSVSSTSTPAVLGASTSSSVTPTDNSSTSTTTAGPADTTVPTTASSGSTTTSSNQ